MPFKILSTKLFSPPAKNNLVFRTELNTRLEQGVQGPLTTVVAPPGFGKTTLLSTSFANGNIKRVAWLSLDEDDGEIFRFFSYIIASIRTLEPDSFQLTESSLKTGSPDSRDIVTSLINDWMECDFEDIVLVLDDYHYVTAQPIHESIAYLIDHLPHNLHLVIISRVDPPLPLGRWRVRGQLAEIRADDLRFNQSETAQFLNQIMGLSLTYLEMILEKNPEVPIILFWDRAPWHRGKPIKKVLEEHPRLEIIFFPTASPDLHPQEHVWKAVRKQVSHNHLETRLPELADRFLNTLNSGIFKDTFLDLYGYTVVCPLFN